MILRKFEEFLKDGTVKKQTSNLQRALSLVKESEIKKNFLDVSMQNIPKDKMNANFIVDYCYDVIMELLRAKMFIDGYNAGNSHEAEVSYMVVIGFSQEDTRFMNELRYYRNGTKYYGTILEMEYARKSLRFLDNVYPKLRSMFKKREDS